MATTGNPKPLMTAPVLVSRCPVFSPSIKGGATDWQVKTLYGTASVKGNLTQIHRNILDAVFGYALATKPMHTGALEILTDPYVIATKTGSSRDYMWLKAKLHDMKVADVDIEEANGLRHHGGIVSEWREAKRRVAMPGGALKGDRPLLAITISAAWMRLHNETLTVSYRDLIPAISELQSGVLQALVRYCLTHRVLNKQLDAVLIEIGAIDATTKKENPRRYERVRKAVFQAELSRFGIVIKNEIVFYKQHAEVRFRNPSDTNCAGPDTTCAASDTICAASLENQELQELSYDS